MLSYEAVFLYCFGLDAGWIRGPARDAPRCCRLRSVRQTPSDDDALLGRFCASFGLLLARIKLQDDARDDNSWLARFTLWSYGSRFQAASEFLDDLDATFSRDVATILREHVALEASGSSTSVFRFSQATADGFARSFGLLANAFDAELAAPLARLGADIGRALIAFDCVCDWEHDRRHGSYNPIRSQSERKRAMESAQRYLCSAGWLCRELFGPCALTPNVLRNVIQRMGTWQRRRESVFRTAPVSTWSGRFAVRRGDCDCGGCLCDGVGAVGDGAACCDAGGSCHEGCGDVLCCPCDACCWDFGRKRKEKATPETTPSTTVGMQGTTIGPLNPMGVVQVGSKNLPAKSEGQWIDDGQTVVVIREDGFGLLVRPVEDRDDQA